MQRRPAEQVSDLPSSDKNHGDRAEVMAKGTLASQQAKAVKKAICTKNIVYESKIPAGCLPGI
ncbi:hypothetical protein [Methanothrix sp.]|uniref:hypothetical protein n=1 Tax=Methanothrix sp. TaxID=90426 RepID=UPI003BB61065